MLKAVIFDMDGVIIDSEALHVEATLKTLQHYYVSPSMEYFNQFVGTTVEFTYEKIRSDFQITDSLEKLLALDKENLKEIYSRRGMTPVPNVIPFIKSLHKSGLRMVIASSSARDRIEEVMNAFGIRLYFEDIISGAELVHSKPAPDIFLKALDVLSLQANEALVIEDSRNGCLAAKAANIACIGYMNPNSGNQDLYSATVVIESFKSITPTYLYETCLHANGEPVTIGATKRLIIKELSACDTALLLQLYKDKDVVKYIDSPASDDEVETEKLNAYFKTIYSFYGYGLWGIFKSDTNELIGRCGFENQMIDGKPEIELSYLLGKKYWGNGYALEACQLVLRTANSRFGIERIVAAIDTMNTPSIQLVTKLGMTHEKTIHYHNRICYLYGIDLIKRRHLEARNHVIKHYIKASDTSVYSKRFTHKSKNNQI